MIEREDASSSSKRSDMGVQKAKRGFFARLFGSGPKMESTVPAGTRVYAIGDIHGRLDLLERLLEMIFQDQPSPKIRKVFVFLGDYVDRGPDSKGVISRLLLPMEEYCEVHFLKGNHEHSLLGFFDDPSLYRAWRHYGAMECLASYGVKPPLYDEDDALIGARDELAQNMPQNHLDFLKGLKLALQIGDYFFVHAGVRPGIPLNSQSQEDLLWIRESFLNSRASFGKIIVHGHSPTAKPAVHANRIGIDTGAYMSGMLTSIVLEGRTRRFLQT